MRRIIHIFTMIVFVAWSAGVISWTAVANQESSPGIEQTFQKAKQDYLDKNLHSASEHINKGAAFMKEQVGKASAKSKKALRESADELEQLAGDVKQGLVSSPKRIEEAFARADKAQDLMARAKMNLLASATLFENPVEARYLASTGIFDSVGGFSEWAKTYGASVKVRKFYNPNTGRPEPSCSGRPAAVTNAAARPGGPIPGATARTNLSPRPDRSAIPHEHR